MRLWFRSKTIQNVFLNHKLIRIFPKNYLQIKHSGLQDNVIQIKNGIMNNSNRSTFNKFINSKRHLSKELDFKTKASKKFPALSNISKGVNVLKPKKERFKGTSQNLQTFFAINDIFPFINLLNQVIKYMTTCKIAIFKIHSFIIQRNFLNGPICTIKKQALRNSP